MQAIDTVLSTFQKRFSGSPTLVCSPGRINVLGEHTDYNDGFVLPAAIDKAVAFAAALNGSSTFNFISLDMNDEYTSEDTTPSDKRWVNYLLGVIAQLHKDNIKVPGFDLVFGGDIPIGAGVSSSAAIECGLLYTLNSLLDLSLSTAKMAQMAQMAEHEYAGVKCGIMDQFAVLHGVNDRVIKLDCRSLEYSLHSLNLSGYSLVLCDTRVTHSLASSAYNQRRKECEECVTELAKHYPVKALRDATLAQLQNVKSQLSADAFKRGEYVIEEIARVDAACAAMDRGDLIALGQLMYQTHEGLQYKYEVSCPELDALVAIAKSCPEVLGARMMGGGFGGCTLNIVADSALDAFIDKVKAEYYQDKNLEPNIIITKLNQGTHLCAPL